MCTMPITFYIYFWDVFTNCKFFNVITHIIMDVQKAELIIIAKTLEAFG